MAEVGSGVLGGSKKGWRRRWVEPGGYIVVDKTIFLMKHRSVLHSATEVSQMDCPLKARFCLKVKMELDGVSLFAGPERQH